jgi:hypothetical protein
MAEVVEAWPTAVGDAIARAAWPARFQRDGTLVVHARDAIWAFELTQRADEITKRLEVAGIKFVPGPVPELSHEDVATPATVPAVASDEQRRQAEEMTAQIDDEKLRKLVQKAVELGLANASDNRSF